jgi:signal transduction histidine kinase
VIANRTDADCAPIEFAKLLAEVAEDQRVVLQASGIELRIVISNDLLTIIGDEIRTLQAVQSALKTAASVSAAGDVVEFLASVCDGYVELIIRNDREHGRSLNSSDRLSISLSQENILSQQGEYEYSEDPFCIRLALPMPP